jgi:hypothetical protein
MPDATGRAGAISNLMVKLQSRWIEVVRSTMRYSKLP